MAPFCMAHGAILDDVCVRGLKHANVVVVAVVVVVVVEFWLARWRG